MPGSARCKPQLHILTGCSRTTRALLCFCGFILPLQCKMAHVQEILSRTSWTYVRQTSLVIQSLMHQHYQHERDLQRIVLP